MGNQYNINRKPLSSEEINQKKDFDRVVNEAKQGSNDDPPGKKWTKKIITTLAVIGGAIVLFFTIDKEDENKEIKNEKSEVSSEILDNESEFNWNFDEKEIFYLTKKADTLTTIYGTQIFIPTNLISNLEDDSLAIQVTEFHDWASISMSEIPMTYDSAGVEYTFKTAGMIDIRPVKGSYEFNEGKKIKVNMVTLNVDPKFNHYIFDEENHQWVYAGKEEIVQSQSNDHLSVNQLEKKEEKLVKEVKKCEKRIVQLKKQEPQPPKKIDNSKYNFNIDIDPSDFPEFQAFKNMRFEVEEGQGFDASVYEVSWDNMELNKKGDNKYQITLIKNNRKEKYTVTPTLGKDDYEKAFREYQTIQSELEQKLLEEEKQKEQYENEINQLKTDYEKKMALENNQKPEKQPAWMTAKSPYYRSIDFAKYQNKERVYKNQFNASRIFSISNFGLYNSDHPLSGLKTIGSTNIKVRFVTKDQKPIEVGTFYLSEREDNVAFKYYGMDGSKFRFNPRKNNIVWGDALGGGIVISDVEDWKDVKENQIIPVTLHKECKTPQKLRELIGQVSK